MEIGLDWKKGTSCVESAINKKEKRWKRGLEQSAAYQWTHGVKRKGKSNESKAQLRFLKNYEKTIDWYGGIFIIINSLLSPSVGGGLLEKNGLFTSWRRMVYSLVGAK